MGYKEKKTLKLHLGCGKRYIPGYIHIDRDKYKHIDYISNIKKLDMFATNSVDLIYCVHAFNYFDYKEAGQALKEWHRVLKKGGILRLSLPSFEAIIRAYNKFKDITLLKNLILGRYEGKRDEIYHKSIYDFRLLEKMLKGVGFKKIRRFSWRRVLPKGYDDYTQAYIPHFERKKGIMMSHNIKAIK